MRIYLRNPCNPRPVLTRFRSAEDVIDIRSLLHLEIEIEPIQPFLQIIQIEIPELQHAVRHSYPEWRTAWAERRLADKIPVHPEHSSAFTNRLILIAEQQKDATARHGIKRLGFKWQRQCA